MSFHSTGMELYFYETKTSLPVFEEKKVDFLLVIHVYIFKSIFSLGYCGIAYYQATGTTIDSFDLDDAGTALGVSILIFD